MTFAHNQPEYSVSEIAGHVKRVVEETFGYVRVRGEVSKTSVNSASGHCYLSLKDDKAVLEAVCWKGVYGRLAHKPEAGMEVIATGKLTTYPGNSKYQLVIEALEPAGIGALMAMLEARKKQLAAEGLFAPERKKPLPFLPEIIGIITSPTGAVIRDMLHRIADRFPRQVLLWPVPVQGAGAAEKIAEAIAGFNALQSIPRPDLIIVARGGGSIEDLWAFNEEIVARAVAASAIPIISAVGHETDTTLIDYVADRRAPTPSAAAEMAVPVRAELMTRLAQQDIAIKSAVQKLLGHQTERIAGLARGLPRPQQLVASMEQALDQLSERWQQTLPNLLVRYHERVLRLAAALSPRFLDAQMAHVAERVTMLDGRLKRSLNHAYDQQRQRLEHVATLLASLDVLAVMRRGFALVKQADGTLIKAAAAMPATGNFTLTFHDGTVPIARSVGQAGAPKKRHTTEAQPQLFDVD